MKEQIKRLVKLQTIKTQINKLNCRLANVQNRIKELDNRVESYEEGIEKDSTALEIKQKEYREFEGEIQVCQSMIQKSQEKMKVVKTNREYRSMLKEIDDLKQKIVSYEESMLTNLEQIDALEKTIDDRKNQFVEIGEEIKTEKEKVQSDASEDNDRLCALQQDWTCGCEEIKPDILQKFVKVSKKVLGPAIVPVQNAVCEGCHMNIPPQTYNEIQRCDSLRFCPHCQRIVYWQGL
jgi:hypothetical protein